MIVQSGGAHKKMKVQKSVPKYTITEDDAKLVAEKVQDCTTDLFEEVEKQRESIMKELMEVKQVLEHI
jgi:ribosome recycling factor